MLQELADLGMQLARRAAQEALQEPDPTPEAPERKMPARPDPRLVFARLARTVRDTLALEARLVAGQIPPAPAEAPDPADDDPRRPAITACLIDAIEASPFPTPARKNLKLQIKPRIAEYLANDPDLTLPGGAIVLDICQELGLHCDMSQMADELLVAPGQTTPPGYEEYRATHPGPSPDPP